MSIVAVSSPLVKISDISYSYPKEILINTNLITHLKRDMDSWLVYIVGFEKAVARISDSDKSKINKFFIREKGEE